MLACSRVRLMAAVYLTSSSMLSSALSAQNLDFAPVADVTLDTDATLVQPTVGPPIQVIGGVFVFRNVTIPAGVHVRGVGSKPMIWICDTMTIDGELTVSGSDGELVLVRGLANVPVRGGRAGAAGGAGGRGSPQIAMRSFAGESGQGPGGVVGMGGTGGNLAILPGLGRGSGGGGGAFATQGDPDYKATWAFGTGFVQQFGLGGFGGVGAAGSSSRSLQPGGPGGSPFADGDDDNDFLGVGFDVFRQRVVAGELAAPVGGSGGGGGGDKAFDFLFNSPAWLNDSRAGAGGGGGGALIVFATSGITVSATGAVTANGGHGSAGWQAGSSNEGGGGGGGSGGLLILASRGQITMHTHGETYANHDYDFALSADGGVCVTGTFSAPIVQSKYPNSGTPFPSNYGTAIYDNAPLGGFGGMGIVELAAPPGNNADGTNTVLDDNIVLVRNGVPLTGAQKQRFLAWRGFKNTVGVRVDDFGVPTNIGNNGGDIRPSPVLLPLR